MLSRSVSLALGGLVETKKMEWVRVCTHRKTACRLNMEYKRAPCYVSSVLSFFFKLGQAAFAICGPRSRHGRTSNV